MFERLNYLAIGGWQSMTCHCNTNKLYNFDSWSFHGSRHLLDLHSCAHCFLGMLQAYYLPWLAFHVHFASHLLWEYLENTHLSILLFQKVGWTNYEGDSLVNSCGDLLCFSLGHQIIQYESRLLLPSFLLCGLIYIPELRALYKQTRTSTLAYLPREDGLQQHCPQMWPGLGNGN